MLFAPTLAVESIKLVPSICLSVLLLPNCWTTDPFFDGGLYLDNISDEFKVVDPLQATFSWN